MMQRVLMIDVRIREIVVRTCKYALITIKLLTYYIYYKIG